MATVEELRLFIQERLRAYDATIPLDTGSPANVQVVEPVVRRFEPDPLETDLELFIRSRLSQEYPGLYSGEGSAIIDALVKPMLVLLEPFKREIRAIKRNQSLLDPTILNKDEADALISNIWISRNLGDYSRVKVRAYFTNPVSVNIGGANAAFTATGLRFIPLTPQSITSEAMLFNQDGDLYYFDIDYIAEGAGDNYNISASTIIGITNLPSATKVTNLRKAEGGISEETTTEMVSRGGRSIGERSLTSVPGIIAKLFAQFPNLKVLNVVGFNDAEMQRDVITGGNLGTAVTWGSSGSTSDDGDDDGYTPYFDDIAASFTTTLGPVGTDLSSYVLVVRWDDEPHDFQLGSVLGATRIEINDSYTGTNRLAEPYTAMTWEIRKRSITLSGIPGGLLFPALGSATIDVEDNQIHVGGCTDFYVHGDTVEDATLVVSLFSTYEVEKRGLTAQTFASSNLVFLNSTTQADFDLIVVGKSTLRLLSGSNQGAYKIIAATYDPGPDRCSLYVDRDATTSESNIRYDITNSIDIGLTDPKEVLYAGSDLRTYAGSTLVDTASGVSWSSWGITADHYIEILNGPDIGEYAIDSVSGTTLTLATAIGQTSSSLQYNILRKQTDGMDVPLLRVVSVELLDSDLKPTGDFIPYRHPVDARSTSFQNPGRGAKAGTDTTIGDTVGVNTGDDPRLLASSEGVNYWDLGVRPGDIVNILTGDNIGYYTVAENGVGGGPGAGSLADNELTITSDLAWTDLTMSYVVGEPSYGSFRIYFLEPLSCSVTYADTLIDATVDAVSRRFRPDPAIWDGYLPTDDSALALRLVTGDDTVGLYTPGSSSDILTAIHDVQVGDRVEFTFAPIVGSKDHASGTTDLNNKTLLVDLGDGDEKITFTGVLTIDQIISQFNTRASKAVASKYEPTSGHYYFTLRSDTAITLKDNSSDSNDATADIFGTTPATYNPWLTEPTFEDYDISNDAPYAGYWYIDLVGVNTINIVDADGTDFSPSFTTPMPLSHYAVISRQGRQRITSTQMASQQDATGLYYFDVECISEGYGDSWNIGPDIQGTVTGCESDGWDIDAEDDNLTYSMAELPWLHVTPRILFTGANFDPANYTELVGSSFQIKYERSPLVEEIDSYVRDVVQRVVCESPLARSLFPSFVRTSISYRGGPIVSEARTELVRVIEAVIPEAALEVSALASALTRLGAEYVQLPVTLIGIVHRMDRTVYVERSQDQIDVGRVYAMIPDDDGTTTEGASGIQLTRL